MTGTIITSNKPIVVLSGAVWSSVGDDSTGDLLVEQMPPIQAFALFYITTPTFSRPAGDLFRLVGKSLLCQNYISTARLRKNIIFNIRRNQIIDFFIVPGFTAWCHTYLIAERAYCLNQNI